MRKAYFWAIVALVVGWGIIALCWVYADAQVYPQCAATQSARACSLVVTVTNVSTPLFAAFSSRQYLLIENQGYLNTTVVNQPVCCAIGTNNQATWDSSHNCNGFVIQAGDNWEPWLFTTPQNPYRVPALDVSCIAPFGNVAVSGEQE